MNSLSLFSGAGGGLLAEKYILNWRSIGYVENNVYCQKVLAQRIEEGFLELAPLWGDIDEFIESGAVDQYKGLTDVVTGGFPCQPFSVAGRRKGKDDSRNCWPQTIEVIRRVRPRWFFGENVPGLLNSGYFPEILGSLAEAGYDAKWTVLGADHCGAPHKRRRLWILAYPNTGHGSRAQKEVHPRRNAPDDGSSDVADSDSERGRGGNIGRKDAENVGKPPRRPEHGCWDVEPDMGRVAHGVASRVDRLKAIGNGQVPLVAATAWKLLSGQELETTWGM